MDQSFLNTNTENSAEAGGQVDPLVRCKCCDQWVDDVWFDTCFDCASTGEERAAKRTVLQHLAKGWLNLRCGNYEYSKYDFSWAWQRMTRTGDYAKGGTFDFEGYEWRTYNFTKAQEPETDTPNEDE